MPLFDDFERHDASPGGHGEDYFTFLNRADGPVWARIRCVLDQWFVDYPTDHAADLRGRFRSRLPGAHLSAWWELYLHHLFSRLQYTVTVHPEVADTSRRPDFEMTSGEQRFYVEGAVVFSGIVDDTRDEVREGWIMDAVNRGTNPNFYVGIEFEQLGEKRPRDRDVYKPLEQWLDTLDPDVAIAQYDETRTLPERTFCIGDWRVRFRAFPLKAEARGAVDPGPLLGAGPPSAGRVDDVPQLRDTLKHKRGRYGHLQAPLIVAINCATSSVHDEDVADALYGSLAYQFHVDEPGAGKAVRMPDGAWIDENGPRGQRMSALLVASRLHMGTVTERGPRLWLHPWAHAELAARLPFTTWRLSSGGRLSSEDREIDMASLLGLPPSWPGPEP